MAWLTTVAKLAPYVIRLGEIGVSALPHFTQRRTEVTPASVDTTLQRQIDELQSAATANAEHIRKLANDLTEAIAALEHGGETIERRFRRLEWLAGSALALSALATASSLALWLR